MWRPSTVAAHCGLTAVLPSSRMRARRVPSSSQVMLKRNSSNALVSCAVMPSRAKNSRTSDEQSSHTRRKVSVAPTRQPKSLVMRLRACHADSRMGAKSSISSVKSSQIAIS